MSFNNIINNVQMSSNIHLKLLDNLNNLPNQGYRLYVNSLKLHINKLGLDS